MSICTLTMVVTEEISELDKDNLSLLNMIQIRDRYPRRAGTRTVKTFRDLSHTFTEDKVRRKLIVA